MRPQQTRGETRGWEQGMLLISGKNRGRAGWLGDEHMCCCRCSQHPRFTQQRTASRACTAVIVAAAVRLVHVMEVDGREAAVERCDLFH